MLTKQSLRHTASDGEVLDMIALRAYGRIDGTVLPTLLAANPGISRHLSLPAGTEVVLPFIDLDGVRDRDIPLWEVPDAPVAREIPLVTREEVSLSDAFAAYLASKNSGIVESVSLVPHRLPAQGTLVSNGDIHRYVPKAGWTGVDRMQFRAEDGEGNVNVDTIEIEVTGSGARLIYYLAGLTELVSPVRKILFATPARVRVGQVTVFYKQSLSGIVSTHGYIGLPFIEGKVYAMSGATERPLTGTFQLNNTGNSQILPIAAASLLGVGDSVVAEITRVEGQFLGCWVEIVTLPVV